MAAYLFLWNPIRDSDSFAPYSQVQSDAVAGIPYETGWICRSKKPQPGDLAFMLRTGPLNNGVFARGTVTSIAFDHDDGTRVVELQFVSFLALGREISRNSIMVKAQYQDTWSPQQSGTTIPIVLAQSLESLWSKSDFSPVNTVSGTPTTRADSYISRIVRDTAITRALKSKYDFKCQLCDIDFPYGSNQRYIEVHHLRPLGLPHDGPDAESNMLVLCPNHHALFDLGVPRFVGASTLDINGTRYILTAKHTVSESHIQYYMKSVYQSCT